MYQEELKYTRTHEWVHMYKHSIARIGLTEFGQQNFGEILFVELPEIESEYEQFDAFVVIEAENMLAEIDAPLGGRVCTVNEEIENDPTIINHDPFGDGWIIEIDIASEKELENLMDYEEYQSFLEEEAAET